MSRETIGRSGFILGVIAALAACVIGAGWQIATRHGVSTTMDPVDLALFRYGIPGLLLAPIWLRHGLLPAGVSRLMILVMVFGAGLPFGLLVITGAKFAPVAHIAVLLPGAMPIFVALFSAWLLRERLGPTRSIGLIVIACGIVAIGWVSISDLSPGSWWGGTWRGDLLFLAAAASWGIYTVAFRMSGLTPWRAAGMINGWSLIVVVPVWLLLQQGTLADVPVGDLAVQIIWQGAFAGVLGLWIYGYAVSKITASRAAAIGALVPAISAVGGWFILGEEVGLQVAFGVVAVTAGVLVSTGALARPFARMASVGQKQEIDKGVS